MALPVILAFLGFVGFIGVVGVAYKMIRPHFSVRVNCWFCQENTYVPYGNRNCWDCLACGQYNGFDERGDYNKPIPAQHCKDLNHTADWNARIRSSEFASAGSPLCDSCNRNQLLKVKQLADFIPFNEANYDGEVEAYKHHLEQVYRLCKVCVATTQCEIQRQDDLLQSRLNPIDQEKLQQTFQSVLSESQLEMEAPDSYVWMFSTLLHGLSLLCIVFLFVTFLPSILESYHVMGHNLCHFVPLPDVTSLENLDTFLIFLGLFLNIFSKLLLGKLRIYLVDGLCSFLWLGLMFIHLFQLQDSKHQSDSRHSMLVICSLTVVMTSVSLVWKRHPRSNPNISVRRLSLETEKSDESYTGSTETSSITQNSTAYLSLPASRFPESFSSQRASMYSQPLQREVSQSPAWQEHFPWNALQSKNNSEIPTRSKPASLFSEPVRRSNYDTANHNSDLNRSFLSAFSEPVQKDAAPVLRHSSRSAFKVIREEVSSTQRQSGDLSFSTGPMYDDIDLELDSINLGSSSLKRHGSGVFSSSLSLNNIPLHGNSSSVPASLRERRPLISPAKLSAVKFRTSTPSDLQTSASPSSQRTLFSETQSVTASRFSSYRDPTLGNKARSPVKPAYMKSSLMGQDEETSRSSQKTRSSFCPVDSTTNNYPKGISSISGGKSWWQNGYVICGVLVFSVVTNIVVVYMTVMKT